MAIGARDPDATAIHNLRGNIQGCPEPAIFPVADLVQELGLLSQSRT